VPQVQVHQPGHGREVLDPFDLAEGQVEIDELVGTVEAFDARDRISIHREGAQSHGVRETRKLRDGVPGQIEHLERRQSIEAGDPGDSVVGKVEGAQSLERIEPADGGEAIARDVEMIEMGHRVEPGDALDRFVVHVEDDEMIERRGELQLVQPSTTEPKAHHVPALDRHTVAGVEHLPIGAISAVGLAVAPRVRCASSPEEIVEISVNDQSARGDSRPVDHAIERVSLGGRQATARVGIRGVVAALQVRQAREHGGPLDGDRSQPHRARANTAASTRASRRGMAGALAVLSPTRARRASLAVAASLVGYATVVNAWCGDDPYITLRAVDNAVKGYGLTWNPHERVQVFTDPLWALLLTAAYAVTREGYFTTMVASIALSLAVVVVLHSAARDRPWWTSTLAALLLVSSKAYVDYSTSGLENPLTHLLVALFFARVFAEDARLVWSEGRLTWLVLLAALIYLDRADAVLAVAPALAWALWHARALGPRALRAIAVGTLPAASWTVFAIVYYGFPFPNTAYAKLNGGHLLSWVHPNGVAYFANSLRMDPLTLTLIGATIAVGAGVALRSRPDRIALLPLAGAAGYLVYAMRIGGDYMSGRLFALPMLLAVIAIVRLTCDRRVGLAMALAGAVLTVVGPRPPLASAGAYVPIPMDRTDIRDERGDYYSRSGLLLILGQNREDPGIARYATGDRDAPQALVWGAIGYLGFSRGPSWDTIDNLGLSDPLLARLRGRAIDRAWGRGHLFRDVPPGYIESVEMGENRIVDPALHRYFDRLLLVTTGPIWRWDRFRAIWEMNTGKLAYLLDDYASRAAPAP
jgi:arabinofuranosyltransferase